MYYLTNDIAVSPETRDALFKEILSGRINRNILKHQKQIKIAELNRFGKEMVRETALAANIRAMLCAATLISYKQNYVLICDVKGDGSYYMESDAFELMFCCLLGRALKYSSDRRIEVDVDFNKENVEINICYQGMSFKPEFIGRFNVKTDVSKIAGEVKIVLKLKLNEAQAFTKKESWDYMSDRLSPVYLGLCELF